MDNIRLGKLFAGKRVEEVLMDIPFMTEEQMREFSEFVWEDLYDATIDGGGGTDEIWALMAGRHDYYADVLEREFDSLVAASVAIRLNDGGKFVVDHEAHQAVLAVFGPMAIKTYTQYDTTSRKEMVTLYETPSDIQVSVPCSGLVVDFMNDRRIHFTNSEWASICLEK